MRTGEEALRELGWSRMGEALATIKQDGIIEKMRFEKDENEMKKEYQEEEFSRKKECLPL